MRIDAIRVRGARQHNLKDLDLDLPRYSLIVVTGLSGSGKSSLAFDTLYAEGQRRYVESLSAYARQFLEQLERPDVDAVEGLSPAIAIEQKTTSKNPRSTVGTVTELYDFLRLLYARVGDPYCPKCGRRVRSQTTPEIVRQVMELPEGSRLQVLAPIVQSRKGEFRAELERLARSGYVRARIDGKIREIDRPVALRKQQTHDIEVVVDRIILRPSIEKRLFEAVDRALQLADGQVIVNVLGEADHLYSRKLACPVCKISVPELTPRSFSFNSPRGACPACEGLGVLWQFDPELIVPEPERSLPDGAIEPWQGSSYPKAFFEALCDFLDVDPDTAWQELPEADREVVLYGLEGPLELGAGADLLSKRLARGFDGVVPILEQRYEEATSRHTIRRLDKYLREAACHACHGARLRPESLSVRVGDLSIAELTALPVDRALETLAGIEVRERLRPVAGPLLKELAERLEFLRQVGLGYLTLDRPAASLAGGESQRIRLATQIGTRLRGVMYVLDEPSIGLHQRDNRRLIEALEAIRDQGNTVIIVEHDEDTIRTADWVVDLGPGAGEHGGWLVAEGPPDAIAANPDSLTGQYLAGTRSIPIPARRREPGGSLPAAGAAPFRGGTTDVDGGGDSEAEGEVEAGSEADGDADVRAGAEARLDGYIETDGAWITVRGARHHNLQDIDVSFPLGCFTVVTGVSGSGKSSLVQDILYRELAQRLYRALDPPGPHADIEGVEAIDKVIDITQEPIGRTPRSNPATYTSAFTPIRQLFASLPESKVRGYDQGRFSFNTKEGRCLACEGNGLMKIEMHFLPDVYASCDACEGRRYSGETLEIRYRGKSIADVLDMTVEHAHEHFANVPTIARKLESLEAVGLGYIRLGQPATTLSGGEAQRIKLAKELAKRATGRTLYILDEPTTGLHFEDIRRLLEVLDALVEQGNTVIVIEHNLEVIKCADWIVDLGPEGGDGGGRVVAAGAPETVAGAPGSHTGRFLRELLTGAAVASSK